MNDRKKLVSVLIITFNHERYIAQAIEGALMQKTNFDYEIVIGEDCSTDKTQEIVLSYKNRYPDIIKVILHGKNVGANQNFIDTFNVCSGKYIAICEGDDYWIDPFKLQKQVDFFTKNPEYGLVHSKYFKLFENNKIIEINNNIGTNSGNIYEEYLLYSFIATCTVMLRAELVEEFLKRFSDLYKHWLIGDRPLFLFVSSKYKCGYIQESTAVYRRHNNSYTNSNDVFKLIELIKHSYEIRKYFISNVKHVSKKIEKRLEKNMAKELIHYYFLLRDNENVQKCFNKIREDKNFENKLYYIASKSFISWVLVKMFLKIKHKT